MKPNPAFRFKSAAKKLFLLGVSPASKVAVKHLQKQTFLLCGLSSTIWAKNTHISH